MECKRCSSKENLHSHHIISLTEGGKDEKDNIEVLCAKCHRAIHSMFRKMRKERYEKEGEFFDMDLGWPFLFKADIKKEGKKFYVDLPNNLKFDNEYHMDSIYGYFTLESKDIDIVDYVNSKVRISRYSGKLCLTISTKRLSLKKGEIVYILPTQYRGHRPKTYKEPNKYNPNYVYQRFKPYIK